MGIHEASEKQLFLSVHADFTMASKTPLKTTFDADRVLRPIFTGGSVAIDNTARLIATALGEDAVLTNPSNGRHLAQIEGVSPALCFSI